MIETAAAAEDAVVDDDAVDETAEEDAVQI